MYRHTAGVHTTDERIDATVLSRIKRLMQLKAYWY